MTSKFKDLPITSLKSPIAGAQELYGAALTNTMAGWGTFVTIRPSPNGFTIYASAIKLLNRRRKGLDQSSDDCADAIVGHSFPTNGGKDEK